MRTICRWNAPLASGRRMKRWRRSADAFDGHAGVRHLRVEDGSGRPLGRSFGVTLWPTLVFLRDGKETGRVVRPTDTADIQRALGEIATTA